MTSTIEDLSEGSFRETIDDPKADPQKIKTLVFTSGKIFFSMNDFRKNENREDIAIVRVEQLYPFPEKQVLEQIAKYSSASRLIWAQDEPINMGAWPYINLNYSHLKLHPVARKESASPAGGLLVQHNQRLQRIIDEVFSNQPTD